MAGRLNIRPGRRALLIVCVLLAHWLVIDSIDNHLASRSIEAAMAPRLTVVYVRQLELTEPPPPAAVVAPVAIPEPTPRAVSQVTSPATPPVAAPALPAASAPEFEVAPIDLAGVALSEMLPLPPAAQADPPTEPPVVADVDAAASQPADAARTGEAAAAPAFVWPPSTRLSYVLTGSYRGEVHGSAQVEWINAQPHYQVNLDVTIGLSFAPLLSRQMRSDGLMVPSGLQPQRYDQRSKTAFQEPRASSLRFHDQQVSTADGRRLPSPFGGLGSSAGPDFKMAVQDSASQFVQLTWLFTTRPHLLTPGTTISFPLALPGRVAEWRYQVGQAQTLYTRFGALEAHRVFTAPEIDRRGDLLAEAWFAPTLAYLPVRIRIEQDAEVYLDLLIKEKPEIATR